MINKSYADFAWDQAAALLGVDSPSGFTANAAQWVKNAFESLGCPARSTASRKNTISVLLKIFSLCARIFPLYSSMSIAGTVWNSGLSVFVAISTSFQLLIDYHIIAHHTIRFTPFLIWKCQILPLIDCIRIVNAVRLTDLVHHRCRLVDFPADPHKAVPFLHNIIPLR